MAHLFRYIGTSDPPAIEPIDQHLREVDPLYWLRQHGARWELSYNKEPLAMVRITGPWDDECQSDLMHARWCARTEADAARRLIVNTLDAAEYVLEVELSPRGDSDRAMALLEPLWEWFFEDCPGLLQLDGGGFFNRGRPLRMETS